MENHKNSQFSEVPELSSTIQDYLSFIYVLERDQRPVVGAHLAELLGVSPPTVTNTLKRMVKAGLITMSREGTHLTAGGWEAARVVMRRHMLMEWMMVRTLPWTELHSEAHHLEHAISASTETALMEQFGQPQICPHGNPLPGCEEAVAGWVALMEVPVDTAVTIRRIHELAEQNRQLLVYLESRGVLPGVRAKVSEILPFNQTITLEVDGLPVILGVNAAALIYVEVM